MSDEKYCRHGIAGGCALRCEECGHRCSEHWTDLANSAFGCDHTDDLTPSQKSDDFDCDCGGFENPPG